MAVGEAAAAVQKCEHFAAEMVVRQRNRLCQILLFAIGLGKIGYRMMLQIKEQYQSTKWIAAIIAAQIQYQVTVARDEIGTHHPIPVARFSLHLVIAIGPAQKFAEFQPSLVCFF